VKDVAELQSDVEDLQKRVKKYKQHVQQLQTKILQNIIEIKNYKNETSKNFARINVTALEKIVSSRVIQDILKMTSATKKPR
jgi:molecular chaperone GrpE (heat shock protein)